MLTSDIENYPGFIEGLAGPVLMGNMRAQAARFGAEFITTKVEKVDLSGPPFGVWAPDPSTGVEVEYRAKSVIVATGARSLMLGLEAESRLLSRGVSTCATCDGFFFRGQEIAVIGGGDSALEEAIFLTKFGETVTVIHRRKELRASKIMQDRAFKNPKIKFVWDSVVTDISGDTKVDGVRLHNTASGEDSFLPVDGVFVAIGHVPNTGIFAGQLDMDEAGYLRTEVGSSATNVPGVFACGDVQDHVYRQAVTAAGTGCMAAIDAERWLEAASTH
jgi:thioredoxin reductase (NADPH)